MANNYHYPIDDNWSTQELVEVLHFFNLVEAYYEDKVNRVAFMEAYRRFKIIVPSKMQEKQLDKALLQSSGYSTYRAVQAVTKSQAEVVSHDRA